jgi:hypothetical protein
MITVWHKLATKVGLPHRMMTYAVLLLSSSNQAFQHIYPDTCGKQVTEKNIGRKGCTNIYKSPDMSTVILIQVICLYNFTKLPATHLELAFLASRQAGVHETL